MNTEPAHPTVEDVTKFLEDLDSAFETELEVEDPHELTIHRVVRIFAEYFAVNGKSFSRKKLQRLGDWINAAVEVPGELENAISTCFLEHSRQLKVNRLLTPYLSKLAKQKSQA